MSDKIGDSADEFYRKANEQLDEDHETLKEHLRMVAKVRKEVVTHIVKISSLVDPRTVSQAEGMATDMAAFRAQLDASMLQMEAERAERDRFLAELKRDALPELPERQ